MKKCLEIEPGCVTEHVTSRGFVSSHLERLHDHNLLIAPPAWISFFWELAQEEHAKYLSLIIELVIRDSYC